MSQDSALLDEHDLQLAQLIRAACLETAMRAYADARMDGLCHEGAWEVAQDALRSLDLSALLRARQLSPK